MHSAPDISTGAGLLDVSFFRRRCRKTIRLSAQMPSTPNDTPSPIPTFSPVDNSLSVGLLEGAEGLEDESRDDKSGEAVAVGVARATLYPNTGIASTSDDSDNVVVTVE